MRTISGGATNPLITAVQTRVSMGLMPTTLISMPTSVATAMSRRTPWRDRVPPTMPAQKQA
jgi:hypothetical protein